MKIPKEKKDKKEKKEKKGKKDKEQVIAEGINLLHNLDDLDSKRPILDLHNHIESENIRVEEPQKVEMPILEIDNNIEFPLSEISEQLENMKAPLSELLEEQKMQVEKTIPNTIESELHEDKDLIKKIEIPNNQIIQNGLEISQLKLPQDINDIVPEYDTESEGELDENYVFNPPSSEKEIEKEKELDNAIPLDFGENKQQQRNKQQNVSEQDEELLKLEKKLKEQVKDPNIKMIHIELNDQEQILLKQHKNKNII